MELVDKLEVPEVVVSLSATLETPNEPEVIAEEVLDVTGTVAEVNAAVKVVEQELEDAKVAGVSKDELNELRGLLRELRNDNISLKTRLSAAERVQAGEFGTDGKAVDPTELEFYQTQLNESSTRDFSNLLAVMEVNPKYEDLREVCTGAHFEDIFERVAKFRSEEGGTDFSVELVKVKAEIWSKPNPYKEMYETIKEYHPQYAVKAVVMEDIPAVNSAKEVLAAATKKVVVAPGSVANLGGGDETKSGWTAEKIDNMPEGKLHTIPKDVYNKWLAGDLD